MHEVSHKKFYGLASARSRLHVWSRSCIDKVEITYTYFVKVKVVHRQGRGRVLMVAHRQGRGHTLERSRSHGRGLCSGSTIVEVARHDHQ